MSNPPSSDSPLIDSFGRQVTYLRVSVTDRCDFRCAYCMSENMSFLPKSELLTYDELERLCRAFIARGVRKIRITGGEPLVRRDIMSLMGALGGHVGQGLDELTVTTNGSQLARYAGDLVASGVKRINVSLDTLDEQKFAELTRWGRLPQVLEGIEAARSAGLKIKINAVALKGVNEDEIERLMVWAHEKQMDLTLIETMPLGDIEAGREDQYLSLKEVRAGLETRFTLEALPLRTGGPARYVRVKETGGRLGFITPLSHNFCESCNRVRVTCTGELYTCLGQDDRVDLRGPLRESEGDGPLHAALDRAMISKPRGHDFDIARATPAVARHMSVTGG